VWVLRAFGLFWVFVFEGFWVGLLGVCFEGFWVGLLGFFCGCASGSFLFFFF
jgi:hypothetical protein